MIEPIGDLIIVERMEKETKTKGGIYLPLPNQKSLGKIISVGKGVLNIHS
ncbi:co-chaperone GroES, partial [bacterium]|nr:co-chaperone GroES [bacterium]